MAEAKNFLESLWGQSPDAVLAQQQQAAMQQSRLQASMNPFEQANYNISMGANALGNALGNLDNPELKKAADIQGIMQALSAEHDPSDQAGFFKKLTSRLSQAGYTKEAMQAGIASKEFQKSDKAEERASAESAALVDARTAQALESKFGVKLKEEQIKMIPIEERTKLAQASAAEQSAKNEEFRLLQQQEQARAFPAQDRAAHERRMAELNEKIANARMQTERAQTAAAQAATKASKYISFPPLMPGDAGTVIEIGPDGIARQMVIQKPGQGAAGAPVAGAPAVAVPVDLDSKVLKKFPGLGAAVGPNSVPQR